MTENQDDPSDRPEHSADDREREPADGGGDGEDPSPSTTGEDTPDDEPEMGIDHPTETVENPSERHGPGTSTTDEDGMSSTRKYVYWATLVMAMLVGFVFVLLFYTNVQSVINEFIARRFRLLFSTAFNLVMVLAAGIVVSLVLRRLEEGRE